MDRYQDLLVALRRINKATDQGAKGLARATGLTTPQLLVMQAVGSAVSMAIGDLAREINLTQATMTSIVNGLERRGLVERSRDVADKRRVLVRSTVEGRRLLHQAPKTLQDILERRFRELEPWEQSFVLAAVERLATLMDAETIDAAPVLHAGAIEENDAKARPGTGGAPSGNRDSGRA